MSASDGTNTQQLQRTPLYDFHVEQGAKLVPFAGYEMPVSYPLGVLNEHLHTRQAAGLFDVSHMGQAILSGPDHVTTATALESLTPGMFLKLGPGRQRYTLLMNDQGGIIDDLMVARPAAEEKDGMLMLVVNASRKDVDYEHISRNLPDGVTLTPIEDRALVALQGPKAAEVLARHCPDAAALPFMGVASTAFDGIACDISRSGYTGEDGYEISMAVSSAEALARALLGNDEVECIGLGARDSLRLEAGLCLYGHDIDEQTSPVEADLVWAIGKRRRSEGGFPGAERVLRELSTGAERVRVGIKPLGRAPAREGTEIQDEGGATVGTVTSGGFGPSVGGPVAMGYVSQSASAAGTAVQLIVRGKPQPAEVAAMPFMAHNYHR